MSKRLSFFFFRNHLSAQIRGVQIARALGARENPTDDYHDDVCILVKVIPRFLQKGRGPMPFGPTYLDYLDYSKADHWLSQQPAQRVIAASVASYDSLADRFPHNPLTLIPQHHCNVERWVRPDRPITTVGYVGVDHAVAPTREAVTRQITNLGLRMLWCTDFRRREDVIAAYQQIDIQWAWREAMPAALAVLKNPLKIINGASFGIPTVAKMEVSFEAECAGRYLPTHTVEDGIEMVRQLQTDARLYRHLATDGLAMAEPYHLDVIADRYRRLAHE
jgi:hypothetical protein